MGSLRGWRHQEAFFSPLLFGLWEVWIKPSNIVLKDEHWRHAAQALVRRSGHVRFNAEAAEFL